MDPEHYEIDPPKGWDAACACGALMRRRDYRGTAQQRLQDHINRKPAERVGLIGSNETDHGPDGFPL